MLAVTLVATGQGVVLCGAVVGALTVLFKAPPLRWLTRTLVKDPALEALRREIAETVRKVLAEHPLTNGWGVTAVQKIADATGADVEPPDHHPPEPGISGQ